MKNIIIFLIAFVFVLPALGQGSFTYNVKVVNRQGNPAKDVKIWLVEKHTGEKIIQRTNSAGQINFNIPPGDWSMNLLGLRNYKEIEVEDGQSGRGSVMFSYDYASIKKEQALMKMRPATIFETIDQSKKKINGPIRGYCVIHVDLFDKTRTPLNKIPVQLVSTKHAKIFTSVTGKKGRATLLVPIGGMYALDVDGIMNYSFTRDIVREGVVTMTQKYEPTSIVETNTNDTIVQQITPDIEATSARSFISLEIGEQGQGVAANENVYLTQLSTGTVYKSRTDENGMVTFLLPNGDQYMLHFEYEKDIDVINLKSVKSRCTINARFLYRPDPKLQYPEQFVPTPQELFTAGFESFVTKQLPKPEGKKVGVFLSWGNKGVNAKSTAAVLEVGVAVTDENPERYNDSDINVAFVVDRSGSMAGYDRIESLKISMEEFIGNLSNNDNIAIVSFESDPYLDYSMQRKGTGATAKQRIAEIEAGGGTNIYKAMVMGYEELLKHNTAERASHLILLTDGYGMTEPAEVVAMSKSYNQQGLGLSAIGVGEDYNSALLTLLTVDQGNLLEHVGEAEGISAAFNNQLSNLLFPVAKDAKLEIVYNDKIVFKKLYGLDEKSNVAGKATFDLNDLYSGYNKVALAKFSLEKADKSIEKKPIVVRLTYTDLETKKKVTVSEKAFLVWDPSLQKIDLVVEQEMKKLYAVAIMNQSMKVMAEAFVAKDYEKAKHAVDRAIAQVKEVYPKAEDEDVDKLVAQMVNYTKALTQCIKNDKMKKGSNKSKQ